MPSLGFGSGETPVGQFPFSHVSRLLDFHRAKCGNFRNAQSVNGKQGSKSTSRTRSSLRSSARSSCPWYVVSVEAPFCFLSEFARFNSLFYSPHSLLALVSGECRHPRRRHSPTGAFSPARAPNTRVKVMKSMASIPAPVVVRSI